MRARAWADLARLCAREQVGKLPAPLDIRSLSWAAYFAPPATWSAKRRTAAIGKKYTPRPDRDNLDKEILDSLFKEDAAITAGHLSKWYGEPERLEITIELEAE